MFQSKSPRRTWLTGIVVALAGLAGLGYYWSSADCKICMAQLTQNLPLTGTIGPVCSINITTLPASGSLPNLALASAQRVEVATLAQTCNNTPGYTLTVSSSHCADTPDGGKLELSTTYYVPYSLEFNNPTTGGSSATVLGLLDGACTGNSYILARDVTTATVSGETSQIFAHYTGSTSLPTGSYSDTVTITMAAK